MAAAPKKVGLEVEIEKLRDQSLVVFRGLVDDAVQKMNKADEELKKQMSEEMKKVQKDATALDALCRNTQAKMGETLKEAMEQVDQGWKVAGAEMQNVITKTQEMLGQPANTVERFSRELDSQLKEYKKRLEEDAERQRAEAQKLADDLKKATGAIASPK